MNLGFLATKDRLIKSRVISGDSQDVKGRFTFRLKGFKDVTYQIFSRSQALFITFPEKGTDWKECFDRVKPHLIKPDGKPAETTGKPSFVKLQKTREKKSGFFEWLDRRAEREERKRDIMLRELKAETEIEHEIMMMDESECTQEKEWEIRKKWRKRYRLDQ